MTTSPTACLPYLLDGKPASLADLLRRARALGATGRFVGEATAMMALRKAGVRVEHSREMFRGD